MCDSEIFADARVCDVCQTDLRLFDVEAEPAPEPSAKKLSNLDALIASIGVGEDVKPDFFEDIKSVGRTGSPGGAELASAGGAAEPAARPKFECPECSAEVDEDARECPNCGAKFAEEVEERFACPNCHADVPADAATCPNCGVSFAAGRPEEPARRAVTIREARLPPPAARPSLDLGAIEEEPEPAPAVPARGPEPAPVPEVEVRARIASARSSRRPGEPVEALDKRGLYRELPRLVNAVKPLLLGAKRAGVDIDEEKKLINEAIASGKSRNIERAVRLVGEAKTRLEEVFTSQLTQRAEALVGEIERAKAAGGNMAPVQALLVGALEALESGEYLEASDRLSLAREEFEKRATGYHRARQALAAADALEKDARAFGVEGRDAERLLRLARESFGRQDWESTANLAEQARASVQATLPGFLEAEMRRARNALLDMKVRGVDLSRPIGILKQASIHLKRAEFVEAMRFVRMYRKEMETVELARPR